MTLMLHAGAEPVTYDGLHQLPMPSATPTHAPLAHHVVVDMVKFSLGYHGHELLEEHFGVTPDGARFFGVLSLRSPYGDYADMVGLRNSHDKTFPISISIGSRVFVCDNLAFSGEHVIKRRHTPNAKRDLPGLVAEVIEPLGEQRKAQAEKLTRYKSTLLSDDRVNIAIMRLYRAGVINVTRIAEVVQAFDQPPHDWGTDRTAWRLFNATTFALTGKVAENPTMTRKLHDIIEGTCTDIT